ncbi:MAG TPA: deoxyribonuclease IV [Limnochordia bacterium]
MRIGCHLSIAGGFGRLMDRAAEVGADVVQYFPKNPKSYRVKRFDPAALRREAAAAGKDAKESVCHSPYVTNLSATGELRGLTVASIVNDLEICEAYGTPYLVVHCGKHVGSGEAAGRAQMVDALDAILDQFHGRTMVLLENTAGQGTELGRTIDELLAIHAEISQPDRVGICFDTCHAFASGLLDLTDWDRFVTEFERPEFQKLLRVIHLNDSKMPAGSRRDRHARLGEGELGEAGLAAFLRLESVQQRPIVIETPVEDELQYADEIRRARAWAAG